MKKKKNVPSSVIAILMLASLAAPGLAVAQQSPIKRIELQRHDLGVSNREVIQVRVDIDPGVIFPRHTHNGEEVIYVLEGTLEYQVEGRSVVIAKAGDVLFVPAGVIHSARNVGNSKASELATYVVEKGKPLLLIVN